MSNTPQSSSNPNSQGCGPYPQISVHVSPTTGGDFYLVTDHDTTVENFTKAVSKKLKVPRDRISLLFRDKHLQEGTLLQHGISDGSRITLLPNVETGLITQRPEVGIMQALESLNDTQVNEFLCGKAPLNLSMRLGDHMMLIQLQLSTVSGTQPSNLSSSLPSSPPSTPITVPSTSDAQVSPTSVNVNPPSLIQASRNLQSTLKRLSADVFSGKDKGRRESVYSGTFSGALNPALQDTKGRPRRDVATIVHILNDLLCSVPELRKVHRKGSEEPTSVPEKETADLPSTSSTCSEDQNLRTRDKMEHLRLVMDQRRERRRQRKQKPYGVPARSSDTEKICHDFTALSLTYTDNCCKRQHEGIEIEIGDLEDSFDVMANTLRNRKMTWNICSSVMEV